jgi:hypothetical protein
MSNLRPDPSFFLLAGAIILSLAGLAGFFLLFVRKMNVYWFILSPMIIAIYQIPAAVVYSLWKKRRRKMRDKEGAETSTQFQ